MINRRANPKARRQSIREMPQKLVLMERAEEFDFTLFVEDVELVISARLVTTANIATKRTTRSH